MLSYEGSMRTLVAVFERAGRVRAHAVLRNMDPKLLQEAGFSPALIEQGLGAWPWRIESDDWSQQGDEEVKALSPRPAQPSSEGGADIVMGVGEASNSNDGRADKPEAA